MCRKKMQLLANSCELTVLVMNKLLKQTKSGLKWKKENTVVLAIGTCGHNWKLNYSVTFNISQYELVYTLQNAHAMYFFSCLN